MGHKLTGCRNGRMCPCGALALAGAEWCEKCRFRARWRRRKMRHGSGTG